MFEEMNEKAYVVELDLRGNTSCHFYMMSWLYKS